MKTKYATMPSKQAPVATINAELENYHDPSPDYEWLLIALLSDPVTETRDWLDDSEAFFSITNIL